MPTNTAFDRGFGDRYRMHAFRHRVVPHESSVSRMSSNDDSSGSGFAAPLSLFVAIASMSLTLPPPDQRLLLLLVPVMRSRRR